MRIKGLFLTATLVFISCSFSQAGTPKIEFSERIWDFGRIPQNSTVTHIFWIKNVGSDTLKGISVKTP
jgi:archaellum component FlaG (FlaF/FlaG flagellin family)